MNKIDKRHIIPPVSDAYHSSKERFIFKLTCKGIFDPSDFMKMLGIRQTKCAHTKRMSRLLEMTFKVFSVLRVPIIEERMVW